MDASLQNMLLPIGGGQNVRILNGITADIGERVTVTLTGDGTFEGRLANVSNNFMLLSLVGPPIPNGYQAGQLVAINLALVAALSRTP